jgi:hypothetical protein
VGCVALCGGLLDCVEASKRFPEVVVGDLVVVDVEAAEDRLVEHTALLIVAAAVKLVGVSQQCDTDVDEPGTV